MSNRRISGAVLLILAGALAFAACKSSSSPDEASPVKDDPSFAADIQTIFNSSCNAASCHGGAAGQAGLVLLSGQAYNNLVNVTSSQDPAKKRVLPGDATNSYIVMKLEGRQTIGTKMPQGGSLASNSLQNIKNWVNKGAKNN